MMSLSSHQIWLGVGFIGQAMFAMRFVIQWIHSERKGESVIPINFWYISIFASLVLCAYAVYRKDPVFILGFSLNIIIYVRNLVLIHKKSTQNTN